MSTKIPSAGKFKRGYKGGRLSTSIDSRPPTDAFRTGWDHMAKATGFGQKTNDKQSEGSNG
jgi:hypothetical protein